MVKKSRAKLQHIFLFQQKQPVFFFSSAKKGASFLSLEAFSLQIWLWYGIFFLLLHVKTLYRPMKRTLKWAAIVLLSPVVLFLLLAVLLYCPPVQNWAVRQVTALVSEQTGMHISVGHVNLEWPLDLGLDHFLMVHEGDTIADVEHLVADVQLRPLFSRRIVVNALELTEARINTNGFISDLQVKGHVGQLSARSRGIDLRGQYIEVNGALLADAQVDIALSDTAAADTTKSDVRWKIMADSLSIHRTAVTLHLPGDSLPLNAYLGHTVARQADMDLHANVYRVESFDWDDGQLRFGRFDVSGIRLGVDSLDYSPQGTRLSVRQLSLREKGGLEISQLTGAAALDSAFSHIQLSHLMLRTPDSDLQADADVDFSLLDSVSPGSMKMRLNAQLGKQDLVRVAALLGEGGADASPLVPQQLLREYPNHPLTIRGTVNGNLERMELTGIDISLPTAFHATADGFVANVRDMERLRGQVALDVSTRNIGFLTTLLPPDVRRNYNLPNGLALKGTVSAEGRQYNANLTAQAGKGTVLLKGSYSQLRNTYDADVTVSRLNLHDFMPRDSLYTLSAKLRLKGQGTDFLQAGTRVDADAVVSSLRYGSLNLDSLSLHATLKDGSLKASFDGDNRLFQGTVNADVQLSKRKIEGSATLDVVHADLQRLGLSDKPLSVGMNGTVDLLTNMAESHQLRGIIDGIYIKDRRKTYHPEKVGLFLRTAADTTLLRLQSGNLIVKADAAAGYQQLLRQVTTLKDSVVAQFHDRVIDQPAIKRLLPTAHLYLSSGRDNPMAHILQTKGLDFRELLVDVSLSPQAGINGDAYLHSLNYDSTRIDTIALRLRQKGDRFTYNGQVTNNRRNPQFVFNTLFDGHIHQHGILIGVRYFDDQGRMGVRLGATAEMEAEGIRLKLMPERPTVGYKEFNLNADNYILLSRNRPLEANIDLIADDRTGVKIYTNTSPDAPPLLSPEGEEASPKGEVRRAPLDLTVSLNRFNLDEFTSVLPYVPRMSGLLNGDFHIIRDQDEQLSVVSDMEVRQMTYEGSPIGNLSTEFNYLQREDNSHAIEARLMLDDEEFGLLSGSLIPPTAPASAMGIDATLTLTRAPLSTVNGFVPDQLIGLDGYGEGQLTIKGTTKRPVVDGEVYLDSAYLVSVPYGVRLRFDNDPVRIEGSHLLLENFGLYAYNDQPLVLMGDIDFTKPEAVNIDLRMQARNYQIVNARQTAKSLAFGKAFVNLYARMNGPVGEMNMRGRLDVLGSTDLTYMLLDSPLSTDNRLDELVRFADFSDTTQTVVTRPTPTGINADLTVSVSQGAHIVCNLNAEQTNYVDIMGGGDLRLRYNAAGLSLNGRYTLTDGVMKYSLPVIPLKTFNIKEGSYVEFTGEASNPRLNITATERVKASVGGAEGGATRSVAFDCGVVITKTLRDMGLQFIISAPEDMTINSELQSMSDEERGKLAVTMLTTGMYLADGNTNGFSMNSALSSFLQGEINQITGSALKTLDVQVGFDNTTDASGQMHTDYSFQFAKRLWNNRVKIEIGGKVSTGSNDIPGQQQSFFDNVSMEYRLNESGQNSVKVFYKQNVYDWLEGYTGEYGVGFIWRRKLDHLWDVFKKSQPQAPTAPLSSPLGGRSSSALPETTPDSVATNKQ
jgi:hypothetical protein